MTPKRKAIAPRASRNPFVQTVLVIGVGVALLGSALTYGLRFPIESVIRGEAVRDIEMTVPPHIIRIVSPEDLAKPMTQTRYEEVNQKIKDYAWGEYALKSGVLRLKLWNAAGTVVYSTLPEQIGDSYPENEHLLQALQGKTVWEVSDETEASEERALGEVMEVYAPLTWQPGDKPRGVVEVYLSYASYARLLASIRNAIFLAVALASLTLPLALLLLSRTGWKALQRERDVAVQRQREVAALNRLLQQDLSHYFELRDRLLNLRAQVMQDPRFQPDATPIPARDAWLLMELREVAAFSENIMASEQQQPKGEAS